MAKRPYTGYDKTADGKRAGFETLIDLLEAHFGLWNNGTFNVRSKRGKSSMSVHATGRAGDLSWRGAPYRGTSNYEDAERMMDWLTEHADALGIEAIFDYYPRPYGRGYKCDRDAWSVYDKRAFSGAPGGDWVHIEISNEHADDPQYYIDFFGELLGDKEIKKPSDKKTSKKPAGKDPWLQVGSKGEQVKQVQKVVGAHPVDGIYGLKTEAAVKKWQADNDLYVDGIIGPSSWQHIVDGTAELSAGAEPPRAEGPDVGNGYPGTPIKRGSRGSDARKVQLVVGATPDGWFGPATERRVKAWQRKNGLVADGIVGPKTWAKMF